MVRALFAFWTVRRQRENEREAIVEGMRFFLEECDKLQVL